MHKFRPVALAAAMIVLTIALPPAKAQTLVWSDEFDGEQIDRSTWTFNTGGSGFGNGELQYYTAQPENAFIDNGDLVIEARREDYLGKSFSSARLVTHGRMAFKYGTLEASIKLPDVDNGMWPAFWLLGNNIGQVNWPACGEIDIMEVGIKDAFLAGLVNRRVVSHAFWDFEGEQADFGDYFDAPVDLYNDYHIFAVEWTPDHIKTFVDGVNTWTMDISDIETPSLEEFHRPMYIITNVAVGGWNFIEITDPGAITAPFPGQMHIDYIRLYDNGDTELYLGKEAAERGTFGVFTETTPVDNAALFDVDAALYIWNNLTESSVDAYEGEEAWTMTAAAGDWFGMGVLSLVDRNMQEYSDGHLHLHMKTTSTDPFKIGVKSSSAGESWVQFIDGEPSFGLLRDGEWHEIVIPLNSFLNVDFNTISQLFMIAGDPPAGTVDFSIDNVYWTPSVERPTPENGNFGIFTEDPAHKTAGEYELGVNGEFYIWENTLAPATQDPYEGTESMSLASTPGLDWFGAAFTPSIKYNLTAFRFPESKLHLALKTSSPVTFQLGMRSGNVDDIGQKWIRFENGSDPYGFVRDGQWHIVEIPMADIADTVDLSQVSMLFELLGADGPVGGIEMDDICLLNGGEALTVGAGRPDADAGDDQQIVVPASTATLDGSNSKDDGVIVDFAWEQASGPSIATLSGADSDMLNVSDLVAGVYVFRLTVTDDEGLTDSDSASVTVATPEPTADAGADQVIALPETNVTLTGSGTDVDGAVVGYAWTQVSGPTPADMPHPVTATTVASNLYAGTYVFELTVRDNDGLTGSDQVTVEVTDPIHNIALGKPVTASSATTSAAMVNGGFESGDGGDADHWTLMEFAAGDSIASASRVNTSPYTGDWCLSLRVVGAANGGPAAEARQTTPTGSITPGNEYDFTAMARRVGPIGVGMVAQLAVQWLDSDGSAGGGVKGETGFMNIQGALTESYTTQGFPNIVAPSGADAAVVILRIAGGAIAGSTGEILFDELTLTSAGGAALDAEYAVDGDAATRWASEAGDPQWIEIDLESRYDIEQVVLDWAAASAQAYDIDVSDNGTDWSTVYSTTAGPGGVEELSVSAGGRFIRLYADTGNTPNGCSLNEFEVYGRRQPGDIDGDEDVDGDDLSELLNCLTGPSVGVEVACRAADLDANYTVDLLDWAVFQKAFTGPQ